MFRTGEYARLCRLDSYDFHIRILLCEEFADAINGAAGSHTTNKVIDLFARLLEDFWRRGIEVNSWICLIRKLFRTNVGRVCRKQGFRMLLQPRHSLGGVGQMNVGSKLAADYIAFQKGGHLR